MTKKYIHPTKKRVAKLQQAWALSRYVCDEIQDNLTKWDLLALWFIEATTDTEECKHESDWMVYTSIPPQFKCRKCWIMYRIGDPTEEEFNEDKYRFGQKSQEQMRNETAKSVFNIEAPTDTKRSRKRVW